MYSLTNNNKHKIISGTSVSVGYVVAGAAFVVAGVEAAVGVANIGGVDFVGPAVAVEGVAGTVVVAVVVVGFEAADCIEAALVAAESTRTETSSQYCCCCCCYCCWPAHCCSPSFPQLVAAAVVRCCRSTIRGRLISEVPVVVVADVVDYCCQSQGSRHCRQSGE
jgi:hypothetical protein